MKALLTITWIDLRKALIDRSTYFNWAISIVMVLVTGLANGAMSQSFGGTPMIIVDVIDHDGSDLSAEFTKLLRESNENFILCPMDNADDDLCELKDAVYDDSLATKRLEDEVALAYIEIPGGFESDLQNGNDVSIIYRSNENAAAPGFILQSVQAVVGRMSGSLVAAQVGTDSILETGLLEDEEVDVYYDAVYQGASAIWAEDPISVDLILSSPEGEEGQVGTLALGMTQSVPGMGTMYVMFSVFPALLVLIQERDNWTLQRLMIAPLSRGQILGGKMLARFMLGMVQYGIAFSIAGVLGVYLGESVLGLLLIMVAFTSAITALSLALSVLVRSEDQAGGVTTFLTLTLAPLGGAWWPLAIVPPFMRTIGHISPVAWAMDGFQILIFEGGGLPDVLIPAAALFSMAIVFFAFGVSRFKYE